MQTPVAKDSAFPVAPDNGVAAKPADPYQKTDDILQWQQKRAEVDKKVLENLLRLNLSRSSRT